MKPFIPICWILQRFLGLTDSEVEMVNRLKDEDSSGASSH